jgi:hypothetical protein
MNPLVALRVSVTSNSFAERLRGVKPRRVQERPRCYLTVERLEDRVTPTIAYVVPAGQVGNQAFGGSLGMDFSVTTPIVIDQLGVFDDGSNGLNLPITARLYNTTTQAQLASLTFPVGTPGMLIGGSRFLPLATPITLPAGFLGTIVAEGYGATEQNGNSVAPP